MKEKLWRIMALCIVFVSIIDFVMKNIDLQAITLLLMGITTITYIIQSRHKE